MNPPPLPGPSDPNKLRLATAANIFLPGAGLIVLGRRRSGLLLAGSFLVCFLGVVMLFLAGYVNYLNTALGDDLLKEGALEGIGDGFHRGWLLTFASFGGAIYIIATVLFSRAKRKA